MPAQDNSRFVIRDRNWHPKALTPDYKTSIARSPRQALVSIPQSISETTGPDFSHLGFGAHDHDLLLNFNNGGLPIGERIIVAGRVVDQYGKLWFPELALFTLYAPVALFLSFRPRGLFGTEA